MSERICARCGKLRSRRQHKYCSPKCSIEARRQAKRERLAEDAALAAARPSFVVVSMLSGRLLEAAKAFNELGWPASRIALICGVTKNTIMGKFRREGIDLATARGPRREWTTFAERMDALNAAWEARQSEARNPANGWYWCGHMADNTIAALAKAAIRLDAAAYRPRTTLTCRS